MSESFKLYGAKEAFAVFNRTQLDSAEKMRFTRSAFIWFNKAIENIKKEHYWKDHTRELTNSHHAKILKPFSISLYNNANHAKFLAFGTRRGIKANPWLKKSVDKVMPQMRMSVTNTARLILEGK